MTQEDVQKLIKILQLNYPATYRGMTASDLKALIILWHDTFKEYDAKIVSEALKAYIKENEYPPTIAGLQKRIEKIERYINGDEIGIDEMWTVFRKAVQNAYPGNTEELFDALPSPVQKFVGGHGELLKFGMLDMNEFRTITRGQFDRAVSARIEQEKEIKRLPVEIRTLIGAVTKDVKEIAEK